MSTLNKEKRRGRPPKTSVSKNNKQVVVAVEQHEEEEIILHLPSVENSDSDNNDNNYNNYNNDAVTNSFSRKNDIMNVTTDRNSFTAQSDSDSNDIYHSEQRSARNCFDRETVTCDEFSGNRELATDRLIAEINKRDIVIQNLKTKLKEKFASNHNCISLTKDIKKIYVDMKLISIEDNKSIVVDKTNICCWWCAHEFDTLPCFMPDYQRNDVYHVFGVFCGFACMLAYNETLDDYKKSTRQLLIKKMYREIFKKEGILNPAGPRESLKKFGGPLDITTFRDPSFLCTRKMKMTLPPMIPLVGEYEELTLQN